MDKEKEEYFEFLINWKLLSHVIGMGGYDNKLVKLKKSTYEQIKSLLEDYKVKDRDILLDFCSVVFSLNQGLGRNYKLNEMLVDRETLREQRNDLWDSAVKELIELKSFTDKYRIEGISIKGGMVKGNEAMTVKINNKIIIDWLIASAMEGLRTGTLHNSDTNLMYLARAFFIDNNQNIIKGNSSEKKLRGREWKLGPKVKLDFKMGLLRYFDNLREKDIFKLKDYTLIIGKLFAIAEVYLSKSEYDLQEVEGKKKGYYSYSDYLTRQIQGLREPKDTKKSRQ